MTPVILEACCRRLEEKGDGAQLRILSMRLSASLRTSKQRNTAEGTISLARGLGYRLNMTGRDLESWRVRANERHVAYHEAIQTRLAYRLDPIQALILR